MTLVFNVTVPTSTDSTGRSVHIAGSLDRLEPRACVRSGRRRTDEGRCDALDDYSPRQETTALEYKYTLGDWEHVEKGAACDELVDRQLTLSSARRGIQTVNDTVSNWRNVAPCGN